MHRRDLLRLLGATAALPFLPRSADAAIAFGQRVHEGMAGGSRFLSPAQTQLLNVVCELIIPRTDTPGALDARVPAFIDHMLAVWYPADQRTNLLTGFTAIDTAAGGSFVKLSPADQVTLLTRLDQGKGETGSAEWGMRQIKSLTLYGYFTSELVVKTVTKEPIMPGRYDGCVPIQ